MEIDVRRRAWWAEMRVATRVTRRVREWARAVVWEVSDERRDVIVVGRLGIRLECSAESVTGRVC